MFAAPRYVHNGFSIAFPRQPDIRRKANSFEDLLNAKLPDHYSQPQVIPVPDDLDPEFPRMIFGSKHGFSQIVISQTNLAFGVQYSPSWQTDAENRRKYLDVRIPVLFDLLAVLGVTHPYFCGLNTKVHMASKATDHELVRHLSRVFLREDAADNIYDLQVKNTSVIGERYFSNTVLQNYRIWSMDNKPSGLPRLPNEEAIERGIQIDGDFNDRYAFNESDDYFSIPETASDILSNGLNEVEAWIRRLIGEAEK